MNRVLLLSIAFLACIVIEPRARAATPATHPTTCPYPTAHDQPLDSKEELLTTTADYRLLRVEFNGVRPGSRVPANVYIPAKSDFKPPYPAALLQYGTGGNKNTNYIVAIGQMAVARGIVVITIDSPNKGERKGKDPKINFLDANFLQYLGDYSRATDYLCSRTDVDAGRLAYVGISWGAITGVTYAAHDPRIAVVASLVGGGNFAGVIPGAVPEDLRKRTEAFDPYYNVKYIAPRPLLLMNVKHDQLVPQFMAESLHKAAPEYAKRVWLDADHFFNGVDRTTTCSSVLDFVLESYPKAK